MPITDYRYLQLEQWNYVELQQVVETSDTLYVHNCDKTVTQYACDFFALSTSTTDENYCFFYPNVLVKHPIREDISITIISIYDLKFS